MLVEAREVSELALDLRLGKLTFTQAAALPELSDVPAREVIAWGLIAVLQDTRRLEAGLDTLKLCRRLSIRSTTSWGELAPDELLSLTMAAIRLSRE